jgi:hypothetical protein
MDWLVVEPRSCCPTRKSCCSGFISKGLRVTLNVHPADGVGPQEDMYEPFMRAMGADPSTYADAAVRRGQQEISRYAVSVHARSPWSGRAWTSGGWTGSNFRSRAACPHLSNLSWLNEYYYRYTGRNGSARPIVQPVGRLGRSSPSDPFFRRRRHGLEDADVRGAVHVHGGKCRLLFLVARHRRTYGRPQRGELHALGAIRRAVGGPALPFHAASPTWIVGPGRTAGRRKIPCGSRFICARSCSRTFTPASGKAARSRCR